MAAANVEALKAEFKIISTDEKMRWIVVGIALRQVVAPVLREFVKHRMDFRYSKEDVYWSTMAYDEVNANPWLRKLNFQNVNNNNYLVYGRNIHQYNYNINSAVDLAKLYLPYHVAQFSAFDELLDMTAILFFLGFPKYFPEPDPFQIKMCANDVRKNIINRLERLDFTEWSATFFLHCFAKLRALVVSLGLTAVVEANVLHQLHNLEHKGCQSRMRNTVDQHLLSLTQKDLKELNKKKHDTSKAEQGIIPASPDQQKEKSQALKQQSTTGIQLVELEEQFEWFLQWQEFYPIKTREEVVENLSREIALIEKFLIQVESQMGFAKTTMKFESDQEECVRVLPYEENEQMVVHLYVFSGESGIPESLKEAARKCFGEMDVRLKWFDLYNDAAYVLNVTAVEYPSGVPQVLNASQVDEISEIISQNLHVFNKHRNITSVQASFKVTDSKETKIPCITINVLGKGHIPIGESEFPGKIGSYPVDVVQGFWFRTSDPWPPNEAQTPGEELRFGASLSVKDEDVSGTFGAIVKDEKSGTLYALSCDHVMQHAEKSEIIHPGLNDYRNYLQYHLNEYKSSVGRIVEQGCSEMKFSVEGLQEPEMKEKFEALKEKKDSYLQESGPEAYPSSILTPITTHETALQTGFSKQPRVIGTYVTGLRRNVQWSDGKEYFVDAAVAKLNVDEVTRSKNNKIAVVIGTRNYPSGECCPAITEDFINTKPELCKSGRTTGYTEKGRLAEAPIFMKPSLYRKGSGALHDVQMHNYVCQVCTQKQTTQSPVEEIQGSQFSCKICGKDEVALHESVWCKNCLYIEGRARNYNFVAPGDSGSVIFEKKRRDENAFAFLSGVGILFAQHENQYKLYGIAAPLDVALKALSQKIPEHKDCDLRVVSNY